MMLCNKMYFSFGANMAGFSRAMQYVYDYILSSLYNGKIEKLIKGVAVLDAWLYDL